MILVLEAAISPLPTPLLDNSPSFIVPYNARWHGISLWLVWVCCPDSVPPPQLLVHPQLLTGRAIQEAEKTSVLCKHCYATDK